MKECSCVNLFSEKNFSLATCKMIFQFGHEKFRLGPAHLGGFSTGMGQPMGMTDRQHCIKAATDCMRRSDKQQPLKQKTRQIENFCCGSKLTPILI